MLSLLARASLEGAVLAAGVWLVCRALPRMSPRTRALLWWCVAAKFVVALVWVAPIRIPVLPRAGATVAALPTTAVAPLPASPSAAAPRPATLPTRVPGAPEIPWTAVLVGAWALGVGIALLRTLHDWRRTRVVVSRSLPADDGLRATVRELARRIGAGRSVDVRVSAEIDSPLIVGVRRPVILVPAEGFAALAPEQQRMALCHELAHLARGDVWLGCVPAAAERCFFFHPLARMAAREYAFWREAACDEAVLTTLGASPQGYGRMLLALGVSPRPAALSAAGAAWSFQNLSRRLTMLDRPSSPSLRGRALAAGAVILAIVAVAPVRAVARPAAPARPQAAAPVRLQHPAAPAAAAPSRPQAAAPAQSRPVPIPAGAAAAPATPAAADGATAAHRAAETAEPQQQELPFVLFRADGNNVMSGNSGDTEHARSYRRGNEPMLWFRYGGKEYVVRDAAVLREAEELWGPVGRIGAEQGRIGAQQGAIGAEQGRIGARQAEIGAQQAALGARQGVLGARLGALAAREAAGASSSDRRDLDRDREQLQAEMRQLGREMEELGRRMREVAAPMRDRADEMAARAREMAAFSGQMQAAVTRANDGMLALVRRSIQSGAAVAVR